MPKYSHPNWAKYWGPRNPFHQNIDVYGNTAVYTCYERLNINPPNGEPVNDTRRITVVLVKQKGEWNGVHLHASYLKPVNPE